ncbi:single-stranded DNA-binding protein [Escherichia coli]
MKNLNRFQFIGNLTKDTELRYTAKSTPIAIFDIAVNGSYKDQETGEIKEYTDFFRIKVWGKAAENAAKFLGKGSQVFVEGSMRNTQYESNGGGKREPQKIPPFRIVEFFGGVVRGMTTRQRLPHLSEALWRDAETPGNSATPVPGPQ